MTDTSTPTSLPTSPAPPPTPTSAAPPSTPTSAAPPSIPTSAASPSAAPTVATTSSSLTTVAATAAADVALTAKAALEQTAAEAKAWFGKFTQKNKDTIGTIGTLLNKAGGFVPLVGPAVTAVGDICTYFADKAEADLKLVADIQLALEELEMKLEVVSNALQNLTDKQKEQSKVLGELKVLFAALIHWGKECKSDKMPSDILGSIQRKSKRLDVVIKAESLAVLYDVKTGVDGLKVTTEIVKDHLIHSLDEVYQEGKDFYKATKWVEAKHKFEEFQRRKSQGEILKRSTGDNSSWYLTEIGKKIAQYEVPTAPASQITARPTG